MVSRPASRYTHDALSLRKLASRRVNTHLQSERGAPEGLIQP